MREIKFKVKIKNDKNLYYVWLINWNFKEVLISKGVLGKIISFDDVVTFLQYIGRKDKKDKEIYEGDTVKAWLSKTQLYWGEVKFEEGKYFIQTFRYSFKPMGRWDTDVNKMRSGISHTKLDISCEMEIVGNVSENPELIKE